MAINHLKSFLIVYFYKIENLLNDNSHLLSDIKFQSQEANTDEYLKIFFKDFLTKHHDIEDLILHELIIQNGDENYTISIDELKNYKIQEVFLPQELSQHQKVQIAKTKKSVYTNPDLYLQIVCKDEVFYESVELKSTKDDKIPGSSVQQISPYEWVIFIKRAKQNMVTTGFYINSITDKLPFPDRSPRPQIGFKNLASWNEKNRKITQNKLLIIDDVSANANKIKLLNDWQDFLADEWLEIVLLDKISKNEKWFNNAIRKFALKLLEHNTKLGDQTKEDLIQKLREQIL